MFDGWAQFGPYPVALVAAAGPEGSILHSADRLSVADIPADTS